FFFSSRRRHTRSKRDWSSDVCSSDLTWQAAVIALGSLAAGVEFDFTNSSQPHDDLDAASQLKADAVFTFPEKFEIYSAGNIATSFVGSAHELALVTDGPFARELV